MTRKKTDKNKNYTPYYIWGLHASIAALNNDNRKIKNIYCSQLVFDKYLDNLVNINSPIKIVKSNDLDVLLNNKVTHQGIVIETLPLNFSEINDSLNNDNTIIALDQVTDPQNVGAIIRTFKIIQEHIGESRKMHENIRTI